MIRKHTVLIDSSIQTADFQAYLAAKKVESGFADLSLKISLQPERSITSVHQELRSVYRTLTETYAQWFFEVSRHAHRTETLLEVRKHGWFPAPGFSFTEVPNEPHVGIQFRFFAKAKRQPFAWTNLCLGALGQEIEVPSKGNNVGFK